MRSLITGDINRVVPTHRHYLGHDLLPVSFLATMARSAHDCGTNSGAVDAQEAAARQASAEAAEARRIQRAEHRGVVE